MIKEDELGTYQRYNNLEEILKAYDLEFYSESVEAERDWFIGAVGSYIADHPDDVPDCGFEVSAGEKKLFILISSYEIDEDEWKDYYWVKIDE